MIRTNVVTLESIPGAIAYRRKMPSGDTGIVIIRADEPQPGIATISKSSGEAVVSTNTPDEAYPEEAFAEAIEQTYGMPYRKQGSPQSPLIPTGHPVEDDPASDEDGCPEERVVDSDAYARIVDAYTDKRGRLSYDLLNKDLIKLVHHSDHVAKMIADGADEQEVWLHAVGTRFRALTGNKNLGDSEVIDLAALIDEVSPKGAFKGLNAKIREMLRNAKNR
jgi:hypothetical protein